MQHCGAKHNVYACLRLTSRFLSWNRCVSRTLAVDVRRVGSFPCMLAQTLHRFSEDQTQRLDGDSMRPGVTSSIRLQTLLCLSGSKHGFRIISPASEPRYLELVEQALGEKPCGKRAKRLSARSFLGSCRRGCGRLTCQTREGLKTGPFVQDSPQFNVALLAAVLLVSGRTIIS